MSKLKTKNMRPLFGTASRLSVSRLLKIIYFFLLLSCIADEAGTTTYNGNYLPLDKSNRWYLTSNLSPQPIMLEVTAEMNSESILKFDNPWFNGEMTLLEKDGRYLLKSMMIDGKRIEMPASTVYFDFRSPKGTEWKNALGTLKIIDRNKTVAAKGAVYKNCIQIMEINNETGDKNFWTFAPNVGFVQFGQDPVAFYLVAQKSHIQLDSKRKTSSRKVNAPLLLSKPFKKDRRLSIAITMSKGQDFASAFDTAKSAGIDEQGGQLNLNWRDLEPQKGQYVDTGDLAFSNKFYPARHMPVSLTIAPIQTNQLVLPNDLKGKPWDDPEVIKRFNALMDFVFNCTPGLEIKCISIGNEIDVYLKGDQAQWHSFHTFFKATKEHIKQKRPDILIGIKATFEGLTQTAKPWLFEINRNSDVVLVTYYPLKSDMTVKPPTTVWGDFDQLTKLYIHRTIYILEAGYPSSTAIGSSEILQEQFIINTFSAWDKHSDQIKLIDFTWLNDISPDALDEISQFYGVRNKNFNEFLRTLGLRTHDGRNKKAFDALINESRARGWR